MDNFDVIVVGGGHAGIEAAAAAARLGCRTALISGNIDTIGKMSCNPAIGGMAKGQLACEVDALGGLMGLATDNTGIQFRLLGRSKGPALWSPRAQCDKNAYARWMQHRVLNYPNLYPVQADIVDLSRSDDGAISGVIARDGRHLRAPRVVVTTGTFLGGLLHQGESKTPGGRMGDAPGLGISERLRQWGLQLIRQKTGTPMRVLASSVRWDLCTEQPGDSDPRPFSYDTPAITRAQVSCWDCHTTEAAHAVIRANLHRAPMYNGQIHSQGPRYCPSIEDKVVRFASRDSHHLFLEPEGDDSGEIYVNGLSTSLPMDVQNAILAAIPALNQAHVLRYGYAVEYDAVVASELDHRLMVRAVPGLYLGGQINGTSGYEEAAVQGLLAGANAALSLAGRDPLILGRNEAYAGVLIDDLVQRAPVEPYRMFTSRAEHRLHLRMDSIWARLTPLAAAAGLVSAQRAENIAAESAMVAAALSSVPEAQARHISGQAMELVETRALCPALAALPERLAEQAWITLRYSGYAERADAQAQEIYRKRHLHLPDSLDYRGIPGLSNEGRAVLEKRRPGTLGEALLLAGVKQTDVELLAAWLSGRRRRNDSS